MQYCRHCFRVAQKCWCSAILHQAPGQTSALWTPPMVSYVAMVSSTETMASTSAARVTPSSYPPPGMPPLEPMDTLPAPTLENLLATAGVSRGGRTRSQPRNTHHSWHPPDEAHSATTAGAHPRKAGNNPGDSLPAAGVPTPMHHPQAEHCP